MLRIFSWKLLWNQACVLKHSCSTNDQLALLKPLQGWSLLLKPLFPPFLQSFNNSLLFPVYISIAAKEQVNATYMTILFPDQIHRKSHRSGKQHITSNSSENVKKKWILWITGKKTRQEMQKLTKGKYGNSRTKWHKPSWWIFRESMKTTRYTCELATECEKNY